MTAYRHRGFTLIELLVTLALVGVVASAALPLVEVTYQRMKEAELRLALRTIRAALDDYRAATESGQVQRTAGESGYPASLEALTQPLQTNGGTAGRDETARTVVVLRRLPRDPFHSDPTASAAQTWRTRAYGARADEWSADGGNDVFDVSSRSTSSALDGSRYADW